jgi:uncharacterized protein
MDLTLDRPGDHHSIRSVSAQGIQIGDHWYTGPLIVSASELLTDWDAGRPAELDEQRLAPVFGLAPEVVLVGTGPQQEFPPPEVLMYFYRRNIGVEFMTTHAACRTFNVLVSENRKVVAALLPPITP